MSFQRFSTIDVVKFSCLVLFNHVSSGVHFSGAALYFLGKIDPAPSKKWPVRLWAYSRHDLLYPPLYRTSALGT